MPSDTFKIVYLIGFVLGSIVRKIYTKRRTPRGSVLKRRTVLDTVLVIAGSIGLIVLPMLYVFSPWLSFADHDLPDWAGWVGAGIFASAVWLLWRSHVDLGGNWSAMLKIRKEHTLVTDGVYRRIRHPMYAAHWLWGIAQALLLHNWIAGPALMVFFVPLYFLRVPREEQMLLDHFGDEYARYMKDTGRVLPRLWR